MGHISCMPGSDPRKHHYQPKAAVLRNFADLSGRLHFWRRSFAPDDVKQSTPASLFRLNDLNAMIDENGKRDVSVELFLGEVDARSTGVVDKLIKAARKSKAAKLDLDDWNAWVEFVYYLFTRSPFVTEGLESHLGIDGTVEGIIQLLEQQEGPLEPDVKKEILSDPRAPHAWRNAVVSKRARPPSSDVVDAFRERGIVVLGFPPGSLIVGDIPMANVRFDGQTTATMAIPVAHDVAFSVSADAMTVRYHSMSAANGDLLNRAIARHSQMIAGRTANRVIRYTLEPYAAWTPADLATR